MAAESPGGRRVWDSFVKDTFEQNIAAASSCEDLEVAAEGLLDAFDRGELDNAAYVELLESVMFSAAEPTFDDETDPELCTQISEFLFVLLTANAP